MARSYEELTGGLGRAVAYRAERYLVRELLPRQTAVLTVNEEEFPLYDVSMNGVSFHATSAQAEQWGIGGEVKVQVLVHGDPVYQGNARVVRSDRTMSHVRVGLQLLTDFLDLIEIRERDEEKSLDKELRQGPSGVRNAVPSAYKDALADVAHFVQFYRRRLERHEARYRDANPTDLQPVEQLASRAYKGLWDQWLHLREQAGRAAIHCLEDKDALKAAKEYTEDLVTSSLLDSPIINRSYTKPLGYPGDFFVMTQVYKNELEGPSAFSKVFHRFVCEEPLASGVRTRKDVVHKIQVEEQARYQVKEKNTDPFRVTSLACGPAREVVERAREAKNFPGPVRWTLIDQEEKALNLAYHDAYREIGKHRAPCSVRCMYMSFGQLLRDPLSALGDEHQHLVYAAGLFDYLSDLSARSLVTTLYERLAPGGLLVVGNAIAGNINFWVPEFILDWSLIYRTEEEMRKMASKLKNAELSVIKEPSNAYYFLLIRKN